MGAYRVTAPYITVRLARDGGEVVQGYYQDAILPAAAVQENVDQLIRKGMLRLDDDVELPAETDDEVDGDEVDGDEVDGDEVDGDSDGDDEPVDAVVDEHGQTVLPRPAAGASKADWLAYVISQRAEGVSEDEARAEAESKTKAELAAKYPVG